MDHTRTLPILIQGGSFDPLHEGHLLALREQDYFLRVLAPTAQNPFKPSQATPFEHRLEMARLVCRAEGFSLAEHPEHGGVYLSEFPYCYAQEFVENWWSCFGKQREIVWAIGPDLVDEIQTWSNGWLVKHVRHVVIPERVSVRSSRIRNGEFPPHPAIIDYIDSHGLYPEIPRPLTRR